MRYRVKHDDTAMSASFDEYLKSCAHTITILVSPEHIYEGNNFHLEEKLVRVDLNTLRSVSIEQFKGFYQSSYKGTIAMRCLESDFDCVPFFESL